MLKKLLLSLYVCLGGCSQIDVEPYRAGMYLLDERTLFCRKKAP